MAQNTSLIIPEEGGMVEVTVNLETYKRLRHLAKHKGKRLPTMVREFVLERLYEEEKRNKIIG